MRFIQNIISTFFKSEEDRKRLYKVVIPSFVVHFIAAILGIVMIFAMTRNLGSKQYGLYTYVFSIVFIIVNLTTNAICIMTVREAPSLLSKGKKNLWKGLHRWSIKFIVLICTLSAALVAIFITVFTFYFHTFKEHVYTIPLLLALTSVPLYGVMNYYAASLRGNYKVVLSLMIDNIVKPLLFLLGIGIVLAFPIQFNAQSAIILYCIAVGGAALFALIAFYKTSSFKGITAEYDSDHWKKTLKSFFLVMAVISLNSRMDILMLGFLKGSSEVGIYRVADMLASKLLIFLQIMNMITAASISRMHTLEEKQKLQNMITKTSRWVFVISIPLFLIFIVFRKWIMNYCGADFETGQTALMIIAAGQLVNIAFGPVGNFALMTGNQRFHLIFTSISVLLNITLNLILTPSLGINGTAIATTASLIFWNTSMFLTIKKKTGLRTWIFG